MLQSLLARVMNRVSKGNGKRFLQLAQLLLLMAWPLLLTETESYFAIYVICSIAAAVAFVLNRSNTAAESKLVYAVTVAFSCLFSLLVLLANYPVFFPIRENLFETVTAFLGGVVVAENVLLLLYRRLPETSVQKRCASPWRTAIAFLVPFGIFSAICLLYLFFSAYPGLLTNDSMTQIRQSLNGITSNHHPFWHTVLIKGILAIGVRLFGNVTDAVALYSVCQVLFFAAAVAFSLMTLYQAGVKKRTIVLCGLPFAVLPYHIVYSVTMWKDVVLAVATLFFVAFFFRTLKGIGNKVVNAVFLFVFTVLFCVWRSNAWLAMVASVVLFFLYLRKRHIKSVVLILAAVVVAWVMRSPVISAMGVQQPDFVESLSIPVQQIARVIVDGGDISDEDYKMLDRIMDVEEVKSLYLHFISDPIKDEIRSKDQAYLVENKMEFLKLWIRVGVHNPSSYVKAWVNQTRGYYNSGYAYWIFPDGQDNADLGVEKQPLDNPINTAFERAIATMKSHVLAKPFISIGFCVWALTALGVVLFLRRREEVVLTIPLLIAVATLLVATPVFSEFRYVYFMFVTLPFLATVGVHKFEDVKGEKENG